MMDELQLLKSENRRLRQSVLVDKITMTVLVIGMGLAFKFALDVISKFMEAMP